MQGVRVLEMSGGLAGAYAARLLASAGADVVLAEPEAGTELRRAGPWCGAGRSAAHEYLNAGKRSVRIEEGSDAHRRLVRWADVVIITSDGDPDVATRRAADIAVLAPTTVTVVVSGFGLTGPWSTWRSSALVDWASSGYLYLTGEPDREPVQGGGAWPSYLAGLTAAVGAQVALIDRGIDGEGQLVDVGAMEAGAAAHQWSLTMYTHTGVVKRRYGLRFGEAFHPMSLYQCADGGWICIGAASRAQWENLCIATESFDLLIDESLFAPGERFERADEIDATLSAWTARYPAEDAVARLQGARVPASEVQDYLDVLASEQLAVRDVWMPLAGEPDGRMLAVPMRLPAGAPPKPAPALGADTAAVLAEVGDDVPRTLPVVDLTRTRVVEFSIAWAGPLAGRFLADLGAEVIKVEHPGSRGLGAATQSSPEGWRRGELPPPQVRAEVYPDADPGDRPWNRQGIWNKMNRGKRSLAIDVKSPGGGEALERLLRSADLVVRNYSPRGARSMGLDAAALSERHPQLSSVSLTGYGETGPMAEHASYGPILEAYGGVDEATGYRDRGPLQVGVAMPDAVGGLHGTFACLDALWERALRGSAVHIDVSQLETLVAVCGEDVLAASVSGTTPPRRGNRSLEFAPQGVYRAAGDDEWVAITIVDDQQWSSLLGLLDDPVLNRMGGCGVSDRHRRQDEIDARIAAWASGRPAFDVAARLQGLGIPACPAMTNRDLVDSDQLAARGFMIELDQPDAGRQRFPGFPIHFGRRRVTPTPAPSLGEGNLDLMAGLGYASGEIERLVASGTIADVPPPG
ncbi:MAG: CaiB/BaiF CoA transferase family protein [Desertimonas sp.]